MASFATLTPKLPSRLGAVCAVIAGVPGVFLAFTAGGTIGGGAFSALGEKLHLPLAPVTVFGVLAGVCLTLIATVALGWATGYALGILLRQAASR
jgi:SNF family Na+-dependent transporter